MKAIDTYWICTAEHGLNASTFTARVVASTGADCGAALSSAVGALSGPLHGGAPAYVKPMLEEVAAMGDPERWVRDALASRKRIMGFGHRVYRAEDPRSRVLKRVAKELGAPNVEVAEQLEEVALRVLQEAHPRARARNQRRVLLRGRARRRRHPAAARAGDVRLLARRGLVGAHPRAEADRSSVPAVGPLRRAGTALPAAGLTRWTRRGRRAGRRARAGGRRARARAAAAAVGRRPRDVGAQSRLPPARARLPRDLAVPLPAEDRAPPPRARGRRAPPAGARRWSPSRRSRVTIRVSPTRCGPLLHRLASGDGNAAVRRLAIVCSRTRRRSPTRSGCSGGSRTTTSRTASSATSRARSPRNSGRSRALRAPLRAVAIRSRGCATPKP